MKIENNNLSALTPKNVESTQHVDKHAAAQNVSHVEGRDKADVSEKARLLAKARAAMETTPEQESEKVAQLRKQVESGDYTVQVEAVARRLMLGVFKH